MQDLARTLGMLYPRDRFFAGTHLPEGGRAVLVGSASEKIIRASLTDPVPTAPESFVVRCRGKGERELGIIAGADSRGTVHGVYAVLRKLGCGFYLSGDALPAARDMAFNFDAWDLADHPLVSQRIVFNWHNFLSGCSTWNLADWQRWTAQSQKMGFNAIMVHAYGNNPMAGFTFRGVEKPVGYLSTTIKGRDWSTMHVADVRRVFGGEVFGGLAFGADAGLVPDDRRVGAARSLMSDVFADAAGREMDVYFAVDVDTPAANPQELVLLLPESARFRASGATSKTGSTGGRIWLPDPDTSEGYAFYRAQVEGLLRAYPQITKLVVWFRADGTPWVSLNAADLPESWRREFAAEVERTPEAGSYWHAPGLFAIGKIVRAFDRAISEVGARRTTVAAGTWGFRFLPAADRFFPAGVPLIGLDYDVLHEKPQLGDGASRETVRGVAAHRPVIPVVWAHHDDGHYVGRPYTPLPEFASKLGDARAAGFGIIHWTTRPLDLYFASLASQVWKSTEDQPLRETCRGVAERWYGRANRDVMGEYLEAWITGAPQFGRETTDAFIDRRQSTVAEVIAGCRNRITLLEKARSADLAAEEQRRLDYQRGLEEFISAFYEAQGFFQDSQDRFKQGDIQAARTLIQKCEPGRVIEQFARFSSIGGITRGELGLIVSLNTRWLSHVVRLRQALGLEPVRIDFGPTSHDPLAQSRGTFTFRFGPGHELWECWGEAETGASAFRLPTPATGAAGVPADWAEVCQTGIEVTQPLNLTLRPVMSGSNRGKGPPPVLPSGEYRLRLLVLNTRATAPRQRVFDVTIGDVAADRVDLFNRTRGGASVVELAYSLSLKTPGAVQVKIVPMNGKVMLCGLVLDGRL